MVERKWGKMLEFSVIFLLFHVGLLFGAALNDFSGQEQNRRAEDVLYYRQPDSAVEHGVRSGKSVGEGCRLPGSWKGKWFQSGLPPIIIDNNKMTTKGDCVENQGDKFLFVENYNPGRGGGGGGCYRCLVINNRHANVLQYKESPYCEEKTSLENLCSQITGDAQLYSLFRIDAPLEECQFKGAPFTFSYNRGYGECSYPKSHVDTCTENTKLLLRYQACPDVQKTESLEEELHCIAWWREGAQYYMVGKIHHPRLSASNEDSYRCFAYEKIKEHSNGHTTVVGYKVAQSGDATCTGVTSSTEGARTMTFRKAGDHGEIKCKYPGWLTSHHWHSLSGKLTARFHHKNSSLHLNEDSRKNGTGGHSTTVLQHNSYSYNARANSPAASLFSGGSRIFCESRKDHSERHTSILARHVNGCQTRTACMQFYKRDSHVVEVQIHVGQDDSECHNGGEKRHEGGEGSEMEKHAPFMTLVSTEAALHRCPYLGKYVAAAAAAVGGTSGGDGKNTRDLCSGPNGGHNSFSSLIVGCGDRAKMEFQSKCPSQESTTYSCHGHWEDEGLGFLIATPMSRSSTTAHRYCFVYTESPDGALRMFSSSESCRRNIDTNTESTWAFNLTSDGQCAEAVTAGSASSMRIINCDTLLLNILSSVMLVLIFSSLPSYLYYNFLSSPSSSNSNPVRLVSFSCKSQSLKYAEDDDQNCCHKREPLSTPSSC